MNQINNQFMRQLVSLFLILCWLGVSGQSKEILVKSDVNEVTVLIDNLSGAILDKEKGEVKWNITLQPLEKRDLQLKYKVKYPKDRSLLME